MVLGEVVAQLLPGYVAHLPGQPADVFVRADAARPGVLEVCVAQGPWTVIDARGGAGADWLDWRGVADGVQVRATAIPVQRWEITRQLPAATGAQRGRHRVAVVASVTDPSRDWRTVRLVCRVPGCAVGRVEGVPALWIGRVAAAIQADHVS